MWTSCIMALVVHVCCVSTTAALRGANTSNSEGNEDAAEAAVPQLQRGHDPAEFCGDDKDWTVPAAASTESAPGCESFARANCTQLLPFEKALVVQTACPRTCGACPPDSWYYLEECYDEVGWTDPVADDGTGCERWLGHNCGATMPGYSTPELIQSTCERTCGLCPPRHDPAHHRPADEHYPLEGGLVGCPCVGLESHIPRVAFDTFKVSFQTWPKSWANLNNT